MLRRHFTVGSEKPDYRIYYEADEEILPKVSEYGLGVGYINNDTSGEFGAITFKILNSSFDSVSKIGFWDIKHKSEYNNIDFTKIALTFYTQVNGNGGHYLSFPYTFDYQTEKSIYDKRYKITKFIIPEGIEQIFMSTNPIITLDSNHNWIDSKIALKDIILPESLKIIGYGAFIGYNGDTIKIPPFVEEIHDRAFLHTKTTIELPIIPPKIKYNNRINIFGENDIAASIKPKYESIFRCYPYFKDLYLNHEDWSKYKDMFDEGYIDNCIVIVGKGLYANTYTFNTYYDDTFGKVIYHENDITLYKYHKKYDHQSNIINERYPNEITEKVYINTICKSYYQDCKIFWKIKELFLIDGLRKIVYTDYYSQDNILNETSHLNKFYYNLKFLVVFNLKSPGNYNCVFLLNGSDITIDKDVKILPKYLLYIRPEVPDNFNMDLVLPDGLEILGDSCIQFDHRNKYNALTIKLGSNIKYIGDTYFYLFNTFNIYINDINDLTKIKTTSYSLFDNANIYINNILLKNQELIIDTDINNNCFGGKKLNDVNIILTDNVKYIHDDAFDSSNLNSIILNNVEHIGVNCFNSCTVNNGIILPESVKYIGNEAFKGFIGLIEIDDINNLDFVGVNAFTGTNIENDLTDEIVYLGNTLYKCNTTSDTLTCKDGIKYVNLVIPNNVNNINLHESVEYINFGPYDNSSINKKSLFYLNNEDNSVIYSGIYCVGCKNLTDKEITIKDNTKLIANGVFCDNKTIEKIEFPDSLLYINDNVFNNCTNLNIELPKNLISIGVKAFSGNRATNTIIIPNSVIYLGKYSFYGIRAKEVIVSDNVEILNSAFKNAYIETITLPKNLKYLKHEDFEGCYALKTIKYNNTMENWYKIEKDTEYWFTEIAADKVICTDGEIILY